MIFKTIAVVIAVLIVAVLLLAATRPSSFEIERSTYIQAPPDTVFMLVEDLHVWPRWSPQDLLNPKMKRTYGRIDTGVGATSDWSGPGKAGKGHMVVTESIPPKSVVVKAYWEKPFATENTNRFTVVPEGAGARLTWSLRGQNTYAMKLMGLFMNMDRMRSEHVELGLSDLKAIGESTVLRKLGQ